MNLLQSILNIENQSWTVLNIYSYLWDMLWFSAFAFCWVLFLCENSFTIAVTQLHLWKKGRLNNFTHPSSCCYPFYMNLIGSVCSRSDCSLNVHYCHNPSIIICEVIYSKKCTHRKELLYLMHGSVCASVSMYVYMCTHTHTAMPLRILPVQSSGPLPPVWTGSQELLVKPAGGSAHNSNVIRKLLRMRRNVHMQVKQTHTRGLISNQ